MQLQYATCGNIAANITAAGTVDPTFVGLLHLPIYNCIFVDALRGVPDPPKALPGLPEATSGNMALSLFIGAVAGI